jgi:antitoxin PrlF
MKHIATVTSKGQITVPLAVRKRLGLKEGDRLEFINEGGTMIVRPVRSDDNPFAAYIGILGPMEDGMTTAQWLSDLRDDEARLEDLAEVEKSAPLAPHKAKRTK